MCGQAAVGGQGIMACPSAAALENDVWALEQVKQRLAAENDRLTARLAEVVDGIGRIAERRMGICPLCDEHWNSHGMACPIRDALVEVYPLSAQALRAEPPQDGAREAVSE